MDWEPADHTDKDKVSAEVSKVAADLAVIKFCNLKKKYLYNFLQLLRWDT